MAIDLLLVLVGFVLLIGGGELLVRGSVSVAERLGVSSLIIGIVLVGFGTSTPELVISLQASLAGSPGISIGNFVGSNIANVLLIVGTAAIVMPMVIGDTALRRDGVVVVAVTVMFVALSLLMPLSRPVGALFVALLAIYLYMACRHDMKAQKAEAADGPTPGAGPNTAALTDPGGSGGLKGLLLHGAPFLMALAGLAILIIGGRILIDSSVSLARQIGVTEAVIGLTIVAVGTSLPELTTSLIAARKGHSDVAIGNVMGSCLYNILGIGGIVGLVAPTNIPDQIIYFDNFVMLGAAVALVALALNGGRITRLEGGGMLAAYAVYIWSLYPH